MTLFIFAYFTDFIVRHLGHYFLKDRLPSFLAWHSYDIHLLYMLLGPEHKHVLNLNLAFMQHETLILQMLSFQFDVVSSHINVFDVVNGSTLNGIVILSPPASHADFVVTVEL